MNEFPIDIPEPNYVYMKTGYSLSIPLGQQGVSDGQMPKAVYESFVNERARLGIEGIVDFPDSKP